MLMFILWNYCERFLAASLKTSRRVGDWWVRESFTHKNKKPDNGPNWTELLAQVCTMGFLLSNYKNLLAIFFYLIFICDSTFGSVSVSPSLSQTPAGLCPVSKLCQSKLLVIWILLVAFIDLWVLFNVSNDHKKEVYRWIGTNTTSMRSALLMMMENTISGEMCRLSSDQIWLDLQ